MWRQPKAVWAVAFASVVAFMGIGLVDPILKPIADNLNASPSQVSLLFTSYMAVMGVAMLITGVAASRIVNSGVKQVWRKKESNGDYVVALFNTGTSGNSTVSVNWSQVGFSGSASVTDLWSGKTTGTVADSYSAPLRPGETRLIRAHPL